MPDDKNQQKPREHTDHYEKNAYEPKNQQKFPKLNHQILLPPMLEIN